MPKVKYGRKEIDFRHEIDDNLKDGYISVDAQEGVVFKSPLISDERAKELVSKKARWINKKLNLVSQNPAELISTGSRTMYVGKNYYTEVIQDNEVKEAKVLFTHSKFQIYVNPDIKDKQEAMLLALEEFYKAKAYEKVMQRINRHIKNTGFEPKDIKIRKLEKRWGSCTQEDIVIFNYEITKLPFSLMDYVIIHELCHIQVKDHSKDFWNIVGRFAPSYKELEEKLNEVKL